jgi:hypothetical protein
MLAEKYPDIVLHLYSDSFCFIVPVCLPAHPFSEILNVKINMNDYSENTLKFLKG